jgi:hypothetical protein
MWLRGVQSTELIRQCIASVPVPVDFEPGAPSGLDPGAGTTSTPKDGPAGIISPA